MSFNIKLNDPDVSIKENVSCHMLPCKIKLNGFCKVSKYFTPYLRKDSDTLTSSLRGFPLQGQEISVPDGYTGIVLRESKQWGSDDKELKATGTFNKFTAWNWDKTPSDDDKLVKALQWISVANVLHQPVSQHDSKSSRSPQKQKKREFSE